MKISAEVLKRNDQRIATLRRERLPWWDHWRKISDFFLPRKYVYLMNGDEARRAKTMNPMILDGTGTQAARILASGMMNGITSPGRPWFRLRLAGYEDDSSQPWRIWLDEVTRRMFLIMSESNFYNAMAVTYLDLAVFGTSAMTIYEDFENVIHCQNHSLGEYYLAQDSRHRVNTFAREFSYTIAQTVEEFGLENCSERVKNAYKLGGSRLQDTVTIRHLIEPNDDRAGKLPSRYAYREFYWESGYYTPEGYDTSAGPMSDGGSTEILKIAGYFDKPTIASRWDVTANDSYGNSPAMDALGDVIQLQQETKAKAKSLDLLHRPPLLADIQLKHRPIALVPGGITYATNVGQTPGVRPIYQVQPPIQEMSMDIQDIRLRIRETFHNDLFRMISQLDTVRSATEIDARREEKLILLGPVYQRFEKESLDPAVRRVFSVAERAGLFPPPPEEVAGAEIEIQYVSILSVAQRAVSVVPTERLSAFVAQIAAGIKPDAGDKLNWDAIIDDYGSSLGVPAKYYNSPEIVQKTRENRALQVEEAKAVALAKEGAAGAKLLSETDVGGGDNALQRLLG